MKPNERQQIEKVKQKWEEEVVKPNLKRWGISKLANQFYSPLDISDDWDFVKKVGFPGQYPFTAAIYPFQLPGLEPVKGGGALPTGGGLVRAGRYSGYGTAEDTRDYYKMMVGRGQRSGPNIAFDLPTQIGYDSDAPEARGEVGKTGVAVDTIEDFEVIFEAFTGDMDLDKIASNFTINAPANIIIAMYAALAEKRGIPLPKLRGTPQNDILKEFVARGTYIFPPKPSMRMTRDSIVYCHDNLPGVNALSICSAHIQQAGATMVQEVAFVLANAIAYVQLGVDAGLNIDELINQFTFLSFAFDMNILESIAARRAQRRMWAKIMKERFGAKNPRSWLLKDRGSNISYLTTTAQRPLNNIVRATLGGIACALSGDIPTVEPPYDEALGLGWSLEAMQLSEDAARILLYEAKLCDVIDPFAGSYFMEAKTDQIEKEAWEIINRIDAMGGAVAAVENGYLQRELAKSAYEFQKQVETGEKVIVGVNRFLGEEELEVRTTRLVPQPYDPVAREKAEEKQAAKLSRIKKERDNKQVIACLRRLEEVAHEEDANTIPPIKEAVKSYATIGEICGVLRKVFGEYQPITL